MLGVKPEERRHGDVDTTQLIKKTATTNTTPTNKLNKQRRSATLHRQVYIPIDSSDLIWTNHNQNTGRKKKYSQISAKGTRDPFTCSWKSPTEQKQKLWLHANFKKHVHTSNSATRNWLKISATNGGQGIS
jgi:hypothetical protein